MEKTSKGMAKKLIQKDIEIQINESILWQINEKMSKLCLNHQEFEEVVRKLDSLNEEIMRFEENIHRLETQMNPNKPLNYWLNSFQLLLILSPNH